MDRRRLAVGRRHRLHRERGRRRVLIGHHELDPLVHEFGTYIPGSAVLALARLQVRQPQFRGPPRWRGTRPTAIGASRRTMSSGRSCRYHSVSLCSESSAIGYRAPCSSKARSVSGPARRRWSPRSSETEESHRLRYHGNIGGARRPSGCGSQTVGDDESVGHDLLLSPIGAAPSASRSGASAHVAGAPARSSATACRSPSYSLDK